MKILLQVILLLAVSLTAFSNEMPGARPPVSFAELKEHFAEPDMLYAPFVFWFWDRPLDNPDIKIFIENMARTMIQQGLNPGYVHARFNMVGEPDLPFDQWLSDDWFRAFERVLSAGEEQNAYLGYVDEFWWPSGRAAGRVLEKNPDLWAESLYWKTLDVAGGTTVEVSESFFVVAARLHSADRRPETGQRPAECRRQNNPEEILHDLAQVRQSQFFAAQRDSLELTPHTPAVIQSSTLQLIGSGDSFTWQAPQSGAWRVYIFIKYFHPGCDGGRLNYLDKRLAQAFLKEAHAPYADRFPRQLGERIPGVYIDHEGDYGYKLAWSTDLSTHYRQKNGRDIRLWMPLLFDEDVEGIFVTARWLWFDAVSDLYVEFFEETNEWCANHRMYAVSNLWEESLMWQASAVGDFFRAQRVFSMPGTDALGLRILEPHDFMESKSVCEFEGRRFQSEIMGAAGFWGFNNITIKQAANAAITWGISHVVPHAVWLTRTLDGNPWLPDWYAQNPWWPQMFLWSDFVRRAGYINSHGHVVADVLLFNPMDSVWGLCGPGVFDPAYKGRVSGAAIQPLRTAEDIDQTPETVKEQSSWWRPPKMDEWYSRDVHHINKIYSQAINDLVTFRVEFLVVDAHYMRQMKIEGHEFVRDPFRFKSLILPALKIVPRDVAQQALNFAQCGGYVYVIASWPDGSIEVGLNDAEMDDIVAALKANSHVIFCDSTLAPELEKNSASLRSHLDFLDGEFAMLQQHRRIDNRDFFWLANNTGRPQKCRLRQTGRSMAFAKWNCESGDIETIPVEPQSDGVFFALHFDPYEAFWLVESKECPTEQCRPVKADTFDVSTSWLVTLNSTQQPPVDHVPKIPATFNAGALVQPADWSEWDLDSFSGVLTYQTEFDCSSVGQAVTLDLGDVFVSASVFVNGKPVGRRLWPPYSFDVTPAIRPGVNKIEIVVANLLNNCYGDARPSGLLGPVKVIVHSR